jgi:hypothetical protein
MSAGLKDIVRQPIVIRNRALAPADIAKLLGVRGDDISRGLLDVLTTQNNKDFFVEYVLGMVEDGDVGFTREAIGAVYDQIVYSLRVSPESMSWISSKMMDIDAIKGELASLYNGKAYSPEEIAAIHKYIDETADAVKNIKVTGAEQYKNFDELRQSAMDEATKWYYKEYPDYTNANAFDALMKTVYPYWTYESQRLFWLPRAFIRHPGVATTIGRYMNNSDSGYIHIPGTSIDINPFRGTVFGTVMSKLTRRDYPEYYDQLGATKGLVEFSDFLSRFGFYPGQPWSGLLSWQGGLESQMGETLPSIMSTPMSLLNAAFPKNEFVKTLTDKIFNDRFRDYAVILEVNKRGGNGTDIWTKIKAGRALTDEEQSLWTSAKREASLYSALFEQTGVFRLRPEEKIKAAEASAQITFEMTGYTPEQQEWLQRHGYKVWDLVGGMSPTSSATLQQLDLYKWVGTNAPLLPSRQQVELNKLDLDWQDITTRIESDRAKKLEFESMFKKGELSPSDYTAKIRDLIDKQQAYIKDKEELNPALTLEGRKEMYKKFGTVAPVQHPMRELLNLYYSIELLEKHDEETGELVADWDTFFANRQAIEEAIPIELKAEWDAYMERNSTPMDKLMRQVNTQYFRKYYSLYEESLKGFTEEEQRVIKEYLYLQRTGQQLERQAAIKEMTVADGKSLIGTFQSNITANRKSLRYANPVLDAWLFYWGRSSSFLTPQAEQIYKNLCADTGRKI